MHKILLLILIYSSICYGQATESVTGNLLNTGITPTVSTSTWQGVGLFNGGLPCWSPDDANKGAYCGPKAYVNGGDINFSYGMSDVHQYVNVAKSLPYSGTGLITTGFRFNWMSKNGNGWEPTTNLDVLSSYVQLYDKGNKLVENFNWDLNYIHNWTTFNIDKNWSKPYRPDQVSNVKFGFVGMDTSYWAGPYGPEVTNISFQLKYKPDPCVKNPFFSPECPNFTKELAEKTATSTNSSVTTTQTNEPIKIEQSTDSQQKHNDVTFGEKEFGAYDEDFKNDKLESALFKIFTDQIKKEEQSINVAIDAVEKAEQISNQFTKQSEQKVMEEVKKTLQFINENQQQQVTQSIEVKQNTQTNIESLFKTPESNTGSLNMFQLPSPQTTKLNDLQPVNNSIQQVNINSNVNRIQQYNIGVTNKPQTEQNIYSLSYVQNNVSTNSFNVSSSNQSININQPTLNNNTSLQTQLEVSNHLTLQPIIKQEIQNLNLPTQVQAPQIDYSLSVAMINQKSEPVDFPNTPTNFLTNKLDPINDIIENKSNIEQEKKSDEKSQNLKNNVPDNDLANGTTISTIAVLPVGYNSYTNLVLKDVAFYEPKEIYRNQRTIDNVRALRNLSSDRLHEEMVNQQYRR